MQRRFGRRAPVRCFVGLTRPRPFAVQSDERAARYQQSHVPGAGSTAAPKESDGSAVSGGKGNVRPSPTRLTKIGTLSPEVIASRIGVKGSSRTNVGCAARCHGGLGVSACARILDFGDGTCDHIHAQSSVAVYDTTSGMNMICFFIRIGKA